MTLDEVGGGEPLPRPLVKVDYLWAERIEHVLVLLKFAGSTDFAEPEPQSAHFVDEVLATRHLRAVDPAAGDRALVAPAHPFGRT